MVGLTKIVIGISFACRSFFPLPGLGADSHPGGKARVNIAKSVCSVKKIVAVKPAEILWLETTSSLLIAGMVLARGLWVTQQCLLKKQGILLVHSSRLGIRSLWDAAER